MAFNAIKFFQDHHIQYDSDGPEVSNGWVNIRCPFCRDDGRHLGFPLHGGSPSCWRCGRHKTIHIIQTLLGLTTSGAYNVLQMYLGGETPHLRKEKKSKSTVCRLPVGCGPLTEAHRTYLRSRKFNSYDLERIWDLRGTGGTGPYKFRIIAPIYLGGQLVSYQGRDYTGLAEIPYKACREELEVVHHKDVVLGYDLVRDSSKVVVVEGMFDAFRLGPGAVATFGCKWTIAQANLLTEFEKVFLLFDSSDDDAVRSSEKLAQVLAYHTNVEIVDTDWDDPGSAPQDEADDFMGSLGFY